MHLFQHSPVEQKMWMMPGSFFGSEVVSSLEAAILDYCTYTTLGQNGHIHEANCSDRSGSRLEVHSPLLPFFPELEKEDGDRVEEEVWGRGIHTT